MPGRHITNDDWEGMTKDQQLLVLDQIARIKAELTATSLSKIGSLVFKNGQFFLDRLISPTMNRYCCIHAHTRRLVDIFKAPKSPYSTAMEFLVDMANLRLLHEATRSTDMTEQLVDVWIYRSIIPSLIPDEFNHGPFFLGHSSLDRTAVLFNDQFQLTGIINWGFSVIEPVQLAALLPAFFKALPINYEMEPDWWPRMTLHYAKALKKYELQIRQQKQKTNDQPFLGDLTEAPSILQNACYFLFGPVSIDNTDDVWQYIIQPTFGGVERAALMDIYRNAHGLLEEFKRTRLFLQS
jgi:hypothetical protein